MNEKNNEVKFCPAGSLIQNDSLKLFSRKNSKDNNNILTNNNNIQYQKKPFELFSNNISNYSETKTIYEFFILSLIKNVNISKETSISLVHNFNKNNFTKLFFSNNAKENNSLLKWIRDIRNNFNKIQNILDNYNNDNEVKNIFFKIISIGLYSNNIEIITIANSMIEFSIKRYKTDLDWFIIEGYLIYISNINYFPIKRFPLVKTLIEIIKGNENIFFQILKRDLISINLKEQITSFIDNIFCLHDGSNDFKLFKINLFYVLQEIYFDYNISLKQKDIPLILNLITSGWVHNPNIFNCNEDNFINTNLNDDESKLKKTLLIIYQENTFSQYGINCISSIINLFLLLNNFGKVKNEDGPLIYKALVFQFINQFNNKYKKEIFLNNFINFFFVNLKFPIDLFLSPYLDAINQNQVITLDDLNFFSIIISHPRFSCENAYEIIILLLDFSFNDILYTKCIIMIINLIFSLNLFWKNKTIYEKIQNKLTSYIIDVLKIYHEQINKKNGNNNENYCYFLLEIVYCILIKKFGNVNNNVVECLIDEIEEYRKINNKNPKELLKLLWEFDIYDDVILSLEEKYFKNNYSKNNKNNVNNSFEKEDLKKNNCIIFQKVKKINVFNRDKNKDRNNIKIIIKPSKSPQNSNKEAKQKVLNDLKRINENKKNQILLEKQKNEKENLLKKKEIETKQRLMRIFIKRGLILGVSKNKNLRPYSYDMEKRGGFLLEEGEGEMMYPYENLFHKRKNVKMKLESLLIYNKYKFIVDFFEEETREIKGIEALNLKYKNKIKLLFNKLVDNHDTISKSSLLKYFREKNISNKEFTLDELSLCVKNAFPDKNLMCFNENEFKKLLIIISYYFMTKYNKMNSLCESYYNFLEIILENLKDNDNWKNNKYLKIKRFLKSKLDINNGHINSLLPPGFKVVPKTNIFFFKQFPKKLKGLFNESIIISYSILDDIILKALKCKHGILENYVKIEKKYDIVIESDSVKPWSQDLMIAYSSLPKNIGTIGLEVADILEEGLKGITLGHHLENVEKMHNKNKNCEKDKNKKIKVKKYKLYINTNKKDISEIKNIKEIKGVKEMKREFKINIEHKRKKEETKNSIGEDNKRKMSIKSNKSNKSNKNKTKKYKTNINELKLKDNNNQKENNKRKKQEDKISNNIRVIKQKNKIKMFLLEQNRKIKEELEKIKYERKKKMKLLKERNHSENSIMPKINLNYFIENKEYIELDKKLLLNVQIIAENNSKINYYLNRYDNHLKLIFEFYHKVGLNTISSINSNDSNWLYFNEYKEFLINFGILNVFISKQQMNFIFKRLSRQNNIYSKDKNKSIENKGIDYNNYNNFHQKPYLTYNDFKMSLLLLLILSNMESDNIQIMKTDYQKLNERLVQMFFEYLEFVVPYFRRDIEDMINQRRKMNNKDFKDWKNKKKNDLLNIFNDLYLNKDDYCILLKKIKSKSDILPSFGDTKITKVLSEKKMINKSKSKNSLFKNNKDKNNKNILKLKYSKTYNEKRKNKKQNEKNEKSSNKDKKNLREIKKRNNLENNEDLKSIDFSLSYTISTNRDKEINSIETNIYTDANIINKSELIKEK